MNTLARSLCALAALCASFCAATAHAQTIHHVSAAAPPGGDGVSWATAFRHVDDALSIATAGHRVWVAQGVYRPTVRRDPADPRSRTFAPAPGVRLLGGFRGIESTQGDRAGLFRTTVLDGDLGAQGVPNDNAYNVVRLEGNGARHWVDGFTIRGGNADSTGLARGGGAIASQLGEKWIRNCILIANRGRIGGALLSQISITHVERCTILSNHSTALGGAVWVGSSLTVTDTLFAHNSCDARGGAVYANQGGVDTEGIATTRFQNCVFRDNRANNGGAVFVGDPNGVVAAGKAAFSGCTFHANTSLTGGAAVATNMSPSPAIEVQLYNSVLWGNRSASGTTLGGAPGHFTDVRYCVVEGGWAGTGNLSIDPMFRDRGRRDLRLSPSSPAIDAGDNELVLRDRNDIDRDGDFVERTPFDHFGSRRRLDRPATPDTGAGNAPVTDMGAYEFRL